jgi:hypothetical protein
MVRAKKSGAEARWKTVMKAAAVGMDTALDPSAPLKGERGTPELQLLTRRQGRDPTEFRERKRQRGMTVDPVVLARDFMILSLAPSTWKAYAAWWHVFETWCSRYGLEEMSAETGPEMQLQLELMVCHLGQEYALSTIETVVAAVTKKFEMERWGSARRADGHLRAGSKGGGVAMGWIR